MTAEKVVQVHFDTEAAERRNRRTPLPLHKTLYAKFAKAPINLAKSLIVAQVGRKKDLTATELKFLEKWRRSIINEDSTAFNTLQRFDLKLNELSEKDKAILESLGFRVDATFEEMSVQDLVFELSEVLNQNLVPEFERQFTTEAMENTWLIKPEYSQRSKLYVNNQRKLLLDRIEDYEWSNSERFTEDDIKNFVQLLSINRGITERDTLKWEKDRQSFLDFVTSINDYDNRWELLDTCKISITKGSEERTEKF